MRLTSYLHVGTSGAPPLLSRRIMHGQCRSGLPSDMRPTSVCRASYEMFRRRPYDWPLQQPNAPLLFAEGRPEALVGLRAVTRLSWSTGGRPLRRRELRTGLLLATLWPGMARSRPSSLSVFSGLPSQSPAAGRHSVTAPGRGVPAAPPAPGAPLVRVAPAGSRTRAASTWSMPPRLRGLAHLHKRQRRRLCPGGLRLRRQGPHTAVGYACRAVCLHHSLEQLRRRRAGGNDV